MKTAYAMPCTQEQWNNEMKPLCDKHGLKYEKIDSFSQYIYLINIFREYGVISNVEHDDFRMNMVTTIPYNPIEFIKACGVEVEHPKWEKLTRGGFEYKIVMEDRGDAFSPMIIIVKIGKTWFVKYLKKNGKFHNHMTESDFDLIPYNQRKNELLTKKAEL